MSPKKSFLLIFITVLETVLWPESCADVFSAMFKMEHLLETRQRVIHDLDAYIDKEENRLRDLKMYSKMYKAEQETAMMDMTHYTGNPINAFILIKRLTSDLDDIEERITKLPKFLSVRNMTKDSSNATILYPTAVDLQGAALALKRLQKTYKLKVEDLANGVLNGVVYSDNRNVAIGTPMTASDCYKIGVIMLEKKDYINALAWQTEALRKFKLEDTIPHFFTKVDIMENIGILHYNLGDIVTAAEWTLKVLELDPENKRAQRNLINYEFDIEVLQNEDEGEKMAMVAEKTDDRNNTNTLDGTGVKDNVGALSDISAQNDTNTKNVTEVKDEAEEGDDVHDVSKTNGSDNTNATNVSDVKDTANASADKPESNLNIDADGIEPVIDNYVNKTENITSSRYATHAKTDDNAKNSTNNAADKAARFRRILNAVIEYRNDTLNYEALCRGEYHIAPEISSRLTCRYLNDKPFLKLAPIKVEQRYIDPDIFIFHNVISDEEIAHVKKLAKPSFQRAMVGDLVKYTKVSQSRVGEIAWLFDDEHVIARLSQRVSDFTGLNMEYSEAFQVSNYGVGGHFVPHYDHSQELIHTHPTSSHRIATAMFYLSDVTQGGATVFMKLGLTVFPVKGSAVFWMNLLPSGEGDMNTKHAACPVLEGSKWVSNKWIRQWGQELIKPCNLEYQSGDIRRQRPAAILKPEILHQTNI